MEMGRAGTDQVRRSRLCWAPMIPGSQSCDVQQGWMAARSGIRHPFTQDKDTIIWSQACLEERCGIHLRNTDYRPGICDMYVDGGGGGGDDI